MTSLWQGSRVHLATTVTDDNTDPPSEVTDYQVAVIPYGGGYTEADWQDTTTYDGKSGVWVEATEVGTYRVLARVGEGDPNERAIVHLDTFNVRSR